MWNDRYSDFNSRAAFGPLAALGSAAVAALGGMGTIASGLTALGTVVSAVGALSAGQDAKNAAEFKAKQEEMRANEERAAGSRQMLQERRQKELALSSLVARGAASGGDTTDTGIVNLAGGIEREGELQALQAFARGENSARGWEDSAMASRASGEAAKRASYFKAGSTILEGGTSLMKQYAGLKKSSGTKAYA